MIVKWLGYLLLFGSLVVIVHAYSERIIDWFRFSSIGTRDYVAEKFALMMLDFTPQQIFFGQLGLSVGLGLVIFLSLLPHFWAGLFFGFLAMVAGWFAPRPIVDWMYRKRCRKIVLQMVDGLSLMANGMRSGLSIVQSLGVAAEQLPNPIQQEFQLILNQNRLGVTVEEAFIGMSKRVQADDVEMFVTAVNILKETGGNLAETFDTIVITIRERIKVESKIEAMTAQGFFQGVFVLCVPPILGILNYLQDPVYMEPLFTSFFGWVILLVIAALEISGFFVILRIIKIDV